MWFVVVVVVFYLFFLIFIYLFLFYFFYSCFLLFYFCSIFSKEHCRMLSQSVHGREVYMQPAGHAGDALTLHGIIEKHVKSKSSLRQQPINGPKVMFI